MKIFLPILLFAQLSFAQYHVSPTGNAFLNSGLDSANAWTLTYALAGAGGTITAGDTIWVEKGTYLGKFTSTVNGSAGSPIIFRNHNNERATIDGDSIDEGSGACITFSGTYTWFWGLELTSRALTKANGNQTYENYSWPDNILQPDGFASNNSGTDHLLGNKVIHCIVHDTRQGLSAWIELEDFECYGSVFYDNGWIDENGEGHGHHWYIQNRKMDHWKKFEANAVLRAYSQNFQAFGSQHFDSLYFDKNALFDGRGRNMSINSGETDTTRYVFYRDNENYSDSSKNIFYVSYPVDWTDGTKYLTVTNNRFWTTGTFTWEHNLLPTVTGNKVKYGSFNSEDPSSLGSGNTWTTGDITLDTVVVIPSTYESKRALVTVWNTSELDSVQVPMTFLTSGDSYTVTDAQNYYGSAIKTGTYAGSPVYVPLTSTSVPAPIGDDPRNVQHTNKRFNTFVVTSTSVSEEEQTAAPVVSSPIYNGATSASGTSSEADGTTILVYVNDEAHGSTCEVTSGTWTQSGLTLATNDEVKAVATASGKTLSEYSNTVTVIAVSTRHYLPVRR